MALTSGNSNGEFAKFIRLVDFEEFKNLSEFPRYPDKPDRTVSLESIDRDTALLVFISHAWIRPKADPPHPDNEANEKFRLCVSGIEFIVRYLAPKMKKCYIWMDYVCIDQLNRESISKSVKCYDKIMECCDAMFTPIVDLGPKWEMSDSISDLFAEYKSPLWNGGRESYLQRAWCRVEMMYAANIPVLGNKNGVKRHTLFEMGLSNFCQLNKRPHLLYGHHEVHRGLGPTILPSLHSSWFDKYHPKWGNLTEPTDAEKVQMLVNNLNIYIAKNSKEGYTGSLNEAGQPHGHGVYRTSDGGAFSGEFINGLRGNWGTVLTCNGDVYQGDLLSHGNNTKEGKGRYIFASGDEYIGEWKNDVYHGRGALINIDGSYYEGDWVDGMKHGKGTYQYEDTEKYEGDFVEDRMEGRGTYTYCDGAVYDGEWKNDVKHGYGTMTEEGIKRYEGQWRHNLMHGQGTYYYASGDVYCGEFVEEVPEGQGTMKYANGDEYSGAWVNGTREGFGHQRYAEGHVYDGEWADNEINGTGTMQYAFGDTYTGNFVYNEKCGKGKLTLEDGDWYEGDFQDDMKEGMGEHHFEGVGMYKGDFKNDEIEGKGVFVYENGDVYTGEWKASKRHGYGCMKYSNGSEYNGKWINGLRTDFFLEKTPVFF